MYKRLREYSLDSTEDTCISQDGLSIKKTMQLSKDCSRPNQFIHV